MIPRVEMRALELLQKGELSKHSLSTVAHCHVRTAQRVLQKLHGAGLCVIVAWDRVFNHPHPIYGKGEVDVPKPPTLTKAERARRYRQNDFVRLREAYRRRHARYLNKANKHRESNHEAV